MNPFQTVELIEAAILVLSVLALVVSSGLTIRAWRTYRVAVETGKCEAVRRIGWMRVRNEGGRVLLVAGVAYAGWVQVTSPPPEIINPNRGVLQSIWLLIAFICLTKSMLNELDAHRIISVIERERAAGRMTDTAAGRAQGNAEGRVEERARADAEHEAQP